MLICPKKDDKQWFGKMLALNNFHSYFLLSTDNTWMSKPGTFTSIVSLSPIPTLEKAITPVLLPGKSHGQRILVGYSPWGLEESDTTERLHFHFSLSCIGAGNGNPLQRSCLEYPRDGGAWWAAVYGVAQSRTRLKRLSSSSIPTLQNTHYHPSLSH